MSNSGNNNRDEILKSNTDLAIIHLNCRSLFSKFDEILTEMNLLKCSFDLMCFSETWLTPSTKDSLCIDGFQSYQLPRSDGRRGGGVGLFVNDNFNTKLVENLTLSLPYIECIFVEVVKDDCRFVVGVVYRPPDSNSDLFIDKINRIVVY